MEMKALQYVYGTSSTAMILIVVRFGLDISVNCNNSLMSLFDKMFASKTYEIPV
jgi:hypothetical protein